jgi:hypothetical protein
LANPEWEATASRVHQPTADLGGERVIPAGPGAAAAKGTGDPTWLASLWWYGTLDPGSHLARATYEMLARPQYYVFNRGWMGVLAAKLGEGDDSYAWARSLLEPGICLFDDTCLGEIVYDFEDFKKTPEIAAHSALLCNVAQMLLGPDQPDVVSVFPAVPKGWLREGVAFSGLAARGGIVVSGRADAHGTRISLENRGSGAATRTVRVRLPEGVEALAGKPDGARVEGGWGVLDGVRIASGEAVTYVLEY